MKFANLSCATLLAVVLAFAAAHPLQALFLAKKNDATKTESRVKSDELVTQGDAQASRRDYVEALKLYDQAIKVDSTNADAWAHRGQVYMKSQRLRSAIADCEQAVKLKPDSPEPYHCRALAHAYLGDSGATMKDLQKAAYESRAGINQGKHNFADSLNDYEILVKLKPQDSMIFWRKATLELAMGRNDAGAKDLDEAIRLAPDNESALQDRARLYERTGHPEKAIVDYSEAIQRHPEGADIYLSRGTVYLQMKDAAKAKLDFDKAVSLNPSYAEVVKRLNEPPASVQNASSAGTVAKPSVAKPDATVVPAAAAANGPTPVISAPQTKTVLIAGNSTSTEKPKAQAPAPAPKSPAPAPVAAAPPPAPVAAVDGSNELLTLLKNASQAEKDKKPDAAIDLYGKALKIKPDLFQTLMDRGRLYATKLSYKEALADFTAAIQVKPDSKDAYFNRCLVNLESGTFQAAADDCTKTIQFDPKAPEPTYYRGLAYFSLRQFDKAAEDFSAALKKKNDDFPEAFYQLGKTYTNIDRPLLALNAYTRAIQERPGYADAYKGRAELRLALGDSLGAGEDESRSKAGKTR